MNIREKEVKILVQAVLMRDAAEASECKFDDKLWEEATRVADYLRLKLRLKNKDEPSFHSDLTAEEVE